MEHEVTVLPSALKREFRAEDIVAAVKYSLDGTVFPSGKRLRIGLINNVPVEIIYKYSDNGDLIVFHCMKCRKKYSKF
ncbi:MAG: hypothetical protein LBL41_05355 [Bifidobacteriaceae bacterium]|jgi:hypothetical protein|nr:hypothetical protein [Bifidobacteriaceae bacterium]